MPDLRTDLEHGLAGRYTIEHELGRGGMATVYLARDLKHDRPVALKVLHPELSASLGPERFQREIRLAARLQHPHILSVYDSGEAGGQLWFTMPYIDGETLRVRMVRERQLAIEDATRIAREAAMALAYAHEQGVIHRDIKPENILLTKDGQALVADFGIARALSSGDRITETGLSVGTPAYMSPEQATGERAVDARTDIYSLGCVLYEMLAAEPPFTGPNTQAILTHRLTESPRPVRLVRETVPAALDAAVMRALARAPADRFATAAEFARAIAPEQITPVATATQRTRALRGPARLRSPVLIALALGFLIGGGLLVGWMRRHGTAPAEESAAGPKLVAVLPFENVGRSEDDYFADGVTDAIRGKLTGLPGLQVTARASAAQYKKSSKTPREIGQELGVQYLLTGTVRWDRSAAGNRVLVSPELIDVSSGASKWQQPFDAALSDVFQVQADIAGRVAQALNLALETPKQEQLAERPTENLAAYDAFLKGEEVAQGIWGTTPATLRRAAGYYEQAVALDSTFALAWAQLSRTLSYAYFLGSPAAADAERARFAADRALALAPARAEGRLALGDYYHYIRLDNTPALAQYEQGYQLAPSNPDLLTGAALTDQNLGKWQESLDHLQKSLAVDPRSVLTTRRLAFTLLWLRRYPEALAACDRALALGPANLQSLETKAMVHIAQGDVAGARAVIASAPTDVEPTNLVVYLSNYWDLFWILSDEQQALLLRLTPRAFDDDRASWAMVMTQTYALRHDAARVRAYADTARAAYEEQLKQAPTDAQRTAFHGLALAYLGRYDEAIRDGRRATALSPLVSDGYNGPYYQHQLARIYLLAGQPDKALDALEPLLKVPYFVSPGWLKVDPNFASLHGNPRFERLVAGS